MEAMAGATLTDERMDGLEGGVDELVRYMETRFDRLEARFDSMQRMTLGAYRIAVIGLVATQI